MVKCAVIGASGYIGGELVRLLLTHPKAELVAITAHEAAGKALSEVHPNLNGVPLKFGSLPEIGDAEVVFLALPNGETMKFFASQKPSWLGTRKVIDTSADFRLRDKATFESFYKTEHPCFGVAREFVYGQPELFASHIAEARNVAAPGCFATATILALYPLVVEGLADHIVINAVTGSSGSGAKAKEKTHHPFRAESYFAYEMFTHRHQPEIKQALKDKTGNNVEFVFQPHSGPFVRGIFVTGVVKLKSSANTKHLRTLYEDAYQFRHFMRLVTGSPNVKYVQGTNFCDISVQSDGHHAVVMTAIDNLMKGGAGQAIQCFNLMHGFEESTGLKAFSLHP